MIVWHHWYVLHTNKIIHFAITYILVIKLKQNNHKKIRVYFFYQIKGPKSTPIEIEIEMNWHGFQHLFQTPEIFKQTIHLID